MIQGADELLGSFFFSYIRFLLTDLIELHSIKREMKRTKENFSKQAHLYRKFRPQYPKALLQMLAELPENNVCLWDCGTGNGQVAAALSTAFKTVQATDISTEQIKYAIPKDNIHYSVQAAEKTSFDANQFDLITVAQAMHWFDFDAFYKEVQRVAKKNAILAIWGYGLLRISEEIDVLIDDYYTQIIGPYWDVERKHIDNHYTSIPFPFEALEINRSYSIDLQWKLDELEGYLNTWSSLQKYLREHATNPVDTVIKQIEAYWGKEEIKEVSFPIFLKIGRLT